MTCSPKFGKLCRIAVTFLARSSECAELVLYSLYNSMHEAVMLVFGLGLGTGQVLGLGLVIQILVNITGTRQRRQVSVLSDLVVLFVGRLA